MIKALGLVGRQRSLLHSLTITLVCRPVLNIPYGTFACVPITCVMLVLCQVPGAMFVCALVCVLPWSLVVWQFGPK